MPGAGEPFPIEFLARIAFTSRRHIGMRQHPMRWYGMAAQDVAAKRLDRLHLRLGEVGIIEIVTGIVDLDAD